jgi:hypothetical protein
MPNPRLLIPIVALAAAPIAYFAVKAIDRPAAVAPGRGFWNDDGASPAPSRSVPTESSQSEMTAGGPVGERAAPPAPRAAPTGSAPVVAAAAAKTPAPAPAQPAAEPGAAPEKAAAMPKIHLRGSRGFGHAGGIGIGFARGLGGRRAAGGRRGLTGAAPAPATGAGRSAAAAAAGAAAFDGRNAPDSCTPGTTRNIQGLCDLLGVKSLTGQAAAASGERSAAVSDKGWSGSTLQGVALTGGPGAATKTPGKSVDPAFVQDPSQPLAADEAPAVQIPAGATKAAPWQKELDAAQMLMKRAGQLIATSSLLVFFGKLLCNTITGAAAGAQMIAAGMVMAGAAAGLAAAATVLGGIILFKYGQKLQGSVITLSALALTIAAVKAAQGDRQAYLQAQNSQSAIMANAGNITAAHSTPFSLVTRDYLSAIRTGLNFAIGDTRAGAIINGGFGLADGISGLVGSGGGLAGFRAGLGLAQTVAGLAPIKGQAGEILNGALTATQIATDMWPTKPASAPAAAEQPAADAKPADPAAPGGQDPPLLEGRQIGNGMALSAPSGVPQNADLLAASREPIPLEGRPLGNGAALSVPDVVPQNGDALAAARAPVDPAVFASRPTADASAPKAPDVKPAGKLEVYTASDGTNHSTLDGEQGHLGFDPPLLESKPIGNGMALTAPSAVPQTPIAHTLTLDGKPAVSYNTGDTNEGGTRAWRDNNPGNIRGGSWALGHGAIGQDDNGYAIFPDPSAGKTALNQLLTTPKYQNMSLQQAMSKYAPPSENPTDTYVAFLTKQTGLSPTTPLSDFTPAQMSNFQKWITVFEGSKPGTVIHR